MPRRRDRDIKNKKSHKNELIKGLMKFYVDIFGDMDRRNEIEDFIKYHGFDVFDGQKRVVCAAPDDDNYVYKIAVDGETVKDNMNEVIWWETLKDYYEHGCPDGARDSEDNVMEITKDDLELFLEAELVNDSPAIIRQKKVLQYTECDEFLDWYEKEKRNAPDFNKANQFARFIGDTPSLRQDHNRIQEILAELGVPSDATAWKEPRNFGIEMEGSKLRLRLLDAGSVFKLFFDRDDNPIRPICPACGKPSFRYLNVDIESVTDIGKSLGYEGQYGCTRKKCDLNIDEIYKRRKPTNKTKDSYVVDDYQLQAEEELEEEYAVVCNYYIPNRKCRNIIEYSRAVKDRFDVSFSKSDLYNMFLIYSAVEVSNEIIGNRELQKLMRDNSDDLMDYDDYSDYAEDALDYGKNGLEDLDYKIIAYTYLASFIEEETSVNMYEVLSADNLDEFEDALPEEILKCIHNDDLRDIFKDLNLCMK